MWYRSIQCVGVSNQALNYLRINTLCICYLNTVFINKYHLVLVALLQQPVCYTEKVLTRKYSVMIRSPRGQLNVTAQSGLPLENSETHRSQEIDTSIVPSTTSFNRNIDNQLVWSSPIRNSLNPQITRQIAYSNCLLDMAQPAQKFGVCWLLKQTTIRVSNTNKWGRWKVCNKLDRGNYKRLSETKHKFVDNCRHCKNDIADIAKR